MPEPDPDPLPPFLEMTTQNLTKSALAASHIEGDYPDPVAVRATIERLPLESTLHRLNRLKERSADHGLDQRQVHVLTLLIGGWAMVVTTARYSRMAGCSRSTAARDIKRLFELGILTRRQWTSQLITYSTRSPL